MADVDFSNAVLDVYRGKPFERSDYIGLNASSYLFKVDSLDTVGGGSIAKITDTPNKVSILYTGTFSASGNQFCLSTQGSSSVSINFAWKVSNISFSSGDSYSFIIDIETSGNV